MSACDVSPLEVCPLEREGVEGGAGVGEEADRWRRVATEQTLKAGGRRKSKCTTRRSLRC